jgi:hypothetical protein
MKQEEINFFEKVQSQLESLHLEIGALSKKSQNDALNKFKLKFVNQILVEANKILGENYKPFPDFEIFNEDEIPSNSDATMVISQYLGCMEKLRTDNITSKQEYNGNKYLVRWYWTETGKQTFPPLKIKEN